LTGDRGGGRRRRGIGVRRDSKSEGGSGDSGSGSRRRSGLGGEVKAGSGGLDGSEEAGDMQVERRGVAGAFGPAGT